MYQCWHFARQDTILSVSNTQWFLLLACDKLCLFLACVVSIDVYST